MAARFSSKSTIQLPRVIVALAIVISVAGTLSFADSGSLVTVIIPGSVVFGMGLYYSGARRYDVMDDRIRIVGVLGDRDMQFSRIIGFDDSQPESFGARLGSFVTGAPMSSAIRVERARSIISGPDYLWVDDREAFLLAARTALAAQTSAAVQAR